MFSPHRLSRRQIKFKEGLSRGTTDVKTTIEGGY